MKKMSHEQKDKSQEYVYDKSSNFAYPFHKVDMTLCKKAIEDLILIGNIEKSFNDEKA